jgi:hypothetical protein
LFGWHFLGVGASESNLRLPADVWTLCALACEPRVLFDISSQILKLRLAQMRWLFADRFAQRLDYLLRFEVFAHRENRIG